MIQEPYITSKEVANYLSVHEMTVYRWAQKGVIPSYKLGHKKRRFKRRFKKSEIDKMMMEKLEARK